MGALLRERQGGGEQYKLFPAVLSVDIRGSFFPSIPQGARLFKPNWRIGGIYPLGIEFYVVLEGTNRLPLEWFMFMKNLLYYHEFVKELCKMRTRKQGFHGKICKSKIKKGKYYKTGKSVYLTLKRVYLKMKLLKEKDCRK